MPENYLKKSLALVAIIICLLLALSVIPEFSIGSRKFKKINLLSDVRPDTPRPVAVVVKRDSVKKKPVKTLVKKDPCKPGITCIEDYSENKKSLSKFFRALRQSRQRPVRVAFFGDSFIEGDILCGNFRDTLQSVFGGRGVGFVPITSEVAQYRTTIQHAFSNWKTFSIVGSKSVFSPPGTAGFCFVPREGNSVEFKPAKKGGVKYFENIRLFYKNPVSAEMHYTINDTTTLSSALKTSDSLQEITVHEKNVASVKFEFNPFDSLKIYGASFEGNAGVYVDNFSMRGNSGMGLSQIAGQFHQQFNRFQDYKLILLQYGLNVVSETDSLGYDWYVDRMVRVVNAIKENFPGASVVLVSVSDRSSNIDGKFSTMPNIVLMRDAQREIATRSHIAFWDLYASMGGENSMLKFVSATPPLAAKDYTHLTYWGGKKIAKKLADALLYERSLYEIKNKIQP